MSIILSKSYRILSPSLKQFDKLKEQIRQHYYNKYKDYYCGLDEDDCFDICCNDVWTEYY